MSASSSDDNQESDTQYDIMAHLTFGSKGNSFLTALLMNRKKETDEGSDDIEMNVDLPANLESNKGECSDEEYLPESESSSDSDCNHDEDHPLDHYDYISPCTPEDDMCIDSLSSRSKKRKATSNRCGPRKRTNSKKFPAQRQTTKLQQFVKLLKRLDSSCNAKRPRDIENTWLHDQCIGLIQELRAMPASVYRSKEWSNALNRTKLGNKIFNLQFIPSDPDRSIPDDLIGLWRNNSIFDALCLLLERWTSRAKVDAWNTDADPWMTYWPPCRRPKSQYKFLPEKSGEELFNILLLYPDAVPWRTDPASIFFLHSEENFVEAYRDWLRFALHMRGVQVSKTHDPGVIRPMFRKIIQRIHDNPDVSSCQKEADQICVATTTANSRELLIVLIDHIRQFHERKKKVKKVMKEHVKLREDCPHCINADEKDKCIIHKLWKARLTHSQLEDMGPVGFTKASLENLRNAPKHSAVEFINPDSIGFERVGYSDIARSKCHRQIIYYYNADTLESDRMNAAGFYAFEAFPQEIYQWLTELSTSSISSITRSKFNDTDMGKMRAWGPRRAAGGEPAAAYVYYSPQNACTAQGLVALLKVAMKEMILREGTRAYLPRIVREMELCRDTDRLGRSGLNLYTCSEYVSPLHFDDDTIDGICWCEEWDAVRSSDDYAFVLAEYGLYVATESNCLWSFDSRKYHATLYPTLIPDTPSESGNSSRPMFASTASLGHASSDTVTGGKDVEPQAFGASTSTGSLPTNTSTIRGSTSFRVGVSRGDHLTRSKKNATAARQLREMRERRYYLRFHHVSQQI